MSPATTRFPWRSPIVIFGGGFLALCCLALALGALALAFGVRMHPANNAPMASAKDGYPLRCSSAYTLLSEELSRQVHKRAPISAECTVLGFDESIFGSVTVELGDGVNGPLLLAEAHATQADNMRQLTKGSDVVVDCFFERLTTEGPMQMIGCSTVSPR